MFIKNNFYLCPAFGKMQEWLNWHAWKACNPLKGFRGSNPRLSAKNDILGGTWNVIFISRKYTEVGGKMLPL